jgi:hypothetical protein
LILRYLFFGGASSMLFRFGSIAVRCAVWLLLYLFLLLCCVVVVGGGGSICGGSWVVG